MGGGTSASVWQLRIKFGMRNWPAGRAAMLVLLVHVVTAPEPAGRTPRNSFLPYLTAIAGVISTGNTSIDSALQIAVSHHLQGWFVSSTERYAAAAQLAPTNMDAYLGAVGAYLFQLQGCVQAARSFRTFLRLHREQGAVRRRDVRCKRAPTLEHPHAHPPGKMRVFIDNGLFVDTSTFRGLAAHVVDEYFCHFDPADVRDGDIVYVNTFLLCVYGRVLHPLIRSRYVLITHNSDFPAPVLSPAFDFSHLLNSPKLLAWFTQNANVRHHKLFPIPQGFSVNTKTFATDWTAQLAFGAKKEMSEERPVSLLKRPHWLYVNFAARNETVRREILEWSQQPSVAHFVTARSKKLTQEEYVKEIKSHRFVWCPPGNGLDTHRIFEALLHGTIPLVLHHPALADMHRKMPVVIIEKAEDVTLELLTSLLPSLQPAVEELWARKDKNVLTANYWREYILQQSCNRGATQSCSLPLESSSH